MSEPHFAIVYDFDGRIVFADGDFSPIEVSRPANLVGMSICQIVRKRAVDFPESQGRLNSGESRPFSDFPSFLVGVDGTAQAKTIRSMAGLEAFSFATFLEQGWLIDYVYLRMIANYRRLSRHHARAFLDLDAEELTQATFAAALARAEEFLELGDSRMLMRMSNIGRDQAKRLRRLSRESSSNDLLEREYCDLDWPSAEIRKMEFLQDKYTKLMELSSDERVAIGLVVIDGYSIRSAATKMGYSSSKLYRILKRGIERLRD